MNLEHFLEHHGLSQNPFDAEEARHDAVFARLAVQAQQNHPDFSKIAGNIDRPASAVVFGEKGSGKTATRLLIDQRIGFHNEAYPDKRVVLVGYDDLNPVLDNFLQARASQRSRFARKADDKPLNDFKLKDHQDAILSLAVTKMVDGLTSPTQDKSAPLPLPKMTKKLVKGIPKQARYDAMALAAIYDQPLSGSATKRWRLLQKKLHTKQLITSNWAWYLAVFLSVLGLVTAATGYLHQLGWVKTHALVLPGAGALGALAVVLWAYWLIRRLRLKRLDKQITRDTPTIRHQPGHITKLLSGYCPLPLRGQPWPDGQPDSDSRYALTQRLLGFLSHLGYTGMTVLVDRVDEPSVISGNADRMKAIIWPMFDNKFLQQESVGIKLLLPIELRHILHRQDEDFFQTARLDKQHMIDRLVWSGATLYDLCSARLSACTLEVGKAIYLTDLFEQPVTREVLIESLDDMQQPREAFKFLYAVLQEHCRMSTQEQPRFLIPQLTLEGIRRQHAQRVNDLRRGVAPA